MAATFTLGVLGVGNMGGALVRGLVRSGALAAGQITIADSDRAKTAGLASELGVQVSESNVGAAEASEFVVLAVKPGVMPVVVKEIAGALNSGHTLVSLAAGVSLGSIRKWLGGISPGLVRVMPNTPALVGAGAMAVAAEASVPAERVEKLSQLLGAVGEVVVVGEELMEAVTGLSGSGPAFVFVMIEALADGGVAAGLPRAVALKLAAQTVFGAAKLVLETGQHPGALKDMVASPGGTTIAGLTKLEKGGFRGAVMEAVKAAAKRAEELSKGE